MCEGDGCNCDNCCDCDKCCNAAACWAFINCQAQPNTNNTGGLSKSNGENEAEKAPLTANDGNDKSPDTQEMSRFKF